MVDVGSTACQICVIIDLPSLSLLIYQSPYISTDYQIMQKKLRDVSSLVICLEDPWQ